MITRFFAAGPTAWNSLPSVAHQWRCVIRYKFSTYLLTLLTIAQKNLTFKQITIAIKVIKYNLYLFAGNIII